jgi:hypothetical protein
VEFEGELYLLRVGESVIELDGMSEADWFSDMGRERKSKGWRR